MVEMCIRVQMHNHVRMYWSVPLTCIDARVIVSTCMQSSLVSAIDQIKSLFSQGRAILLLYALFGWERKCSRMSCARPLSSKMMDWSAIQSIQLTFLILALHTIPGSEALRGIPFLCWNEWQKPLGPKRGAKYLYSFGNTAYFVNNHMDLLEVSKFFLRDCWIKVPNVCLLFLFMTEYTFPVFLTHYMWIMYGGSWTMQSFAEMGWSY